MNPTKYLLILAITITSALSFYGQPAADLKRASELFKSAVEKYNKAQYDAAITDYSEYLKIRPTAVGWYNRGLAYNRKAEAAMSRADFERAEADFSQAIKLDANDADFWLNRGHVRSRLVSVDFKNKLPLAIADYTQVIKLRPNSSEGYTGRGRMYEESNQQTQAMADLNKAIQLNANDYIAYYTRGKLHNYANNYAAARSDLETAIRLYPDYAAAKSYLNYVNSEASKTIVAKTTSTPVAVSPATTSSSANSDVSIGAGYGRAENAEKAGDHKAVIDAVNNTLPLIRLRAAGEPVDDLMTPLYLGLLRKRAKAFNALKRYKEADADHNAAALASIKNINRHNAAANAELSKDKISGGGMIMGSLETGRATLICKSAFDGVSAWVASVQRDRPGDMAAGISASIVMAAVRESCAQAYVMHGMFTHGKARPGDPNGTRHLNAAIEHLTEAIRYQQVFREAYVYRAKVYRELGRADLAAADEKKARELPIDED